MEALMNPWLLAAGLAALVIDLVHVFYGGREIHRPMVAAPWPEPAKAVWSVVWHAATAVMALGGLALIVAGLMPDHALALAVLPVALFLCTAVLFLVYGLKRLGTVWVLPHWIGFLGVSALALVGLG
jgi:hypothetical protein